MADYYWVGNQTTGSVLTASTAANWSLSSTGLGATPPLPGVTDDCIFGDPLTLKANIGNAVCEWDIAQVQSISVEEGYRYTTTITATDIAFARAANTLTISSRTWGELGFRVGMYITISGSAANSGSFYITAIANSTLTINSVTVDETVGSTVTVSSESSVDIKTDVTLGNTSSGQTALALNGALKNTRGSNSTITFTGIPNSDTRFITNGDFAAIYNQNHLTYSFGSGISSLIYFDDGPYPTVSSTQALTFRSEYFKAPTSDIHGEVTMYALSLTNTGVSFTSSRSTVRDDTRKVFRVLNTSTFDYNGNTFDAGFCKWIFKLNASNWPFPISGSTSYGANDGTFKGIWYDVVLQTDTDGFKSTIPQGRALSVNSLKIESGAVLEGYETTAQSETSVITSVKRPVVEGAWNFSQVADGVYSSVLSDTYLVTPSHGVGGRVQLSDHAGKFTSDAKLTWTSATSTLLVNGKLDVTGLIDPTGMQFDRQATNPGTADTVWVNNSGALMFGTSAVGGGGGSGTVTSVAVSGSDGIEVDSGSPVTTSGTIALGVNKTNMLSHLNVEDGADVTDATNVTAAGALMDSELTDLAGVKGVTISTLQPKPSEGAFANGDKTKLDGIAASATAYTDAAAIAAVEGESTLTLQSGVTVGTRLKLQGFSSSDHVQIENVTQDGDVIFKVNDGGVTTEAMRIEGSSGFVGIGDTNPDAPLHINGSTSGTILKVETTSTDGMSPDMEFYSGRAPVAGDNQGNIEFNGRNELTVGANDGVAYQYARIYGGIDAASGSTVDGTEAGKLGLQIQHQGANKTMFFMEGHPTGGGFITVNYNGVDMDFRVHGEDTSNLFFINGGSGYEGVAVGGQTVPKSMFTVDGTITLKEQAAADTDSTAYGQIWVKTATPNELYFTTDAGNDIQLTSGTSIAGGGGGSGDVVGPGSATNNNFVAFDGTTGKLVKDSTTSASSFASAAQGALATSALQPGQAGLDPYVPLNPAFWGGFGPPPDIQEAIQRIAQQLVALGGPIP